MRTYIFIKCCACSKFIFLLRRGANFDIPDLQAGWEYLPTRRQAGDETLDWREDPSLKIKVIRGKLFYFYFVNHLAVFFNVVTFFQALTHSVNATATLARGQDHPTQMSAT